MQDTKLFWFTQVLSKTLHGRTLQWEGDIALSPRKADFFYWKDRQPEAKSKGYRVRLILFLSLNLVPGITGFYLPFLW